LVCVLPCFPSSSPSSRLPSSRLPPTVGAALVKTRASASRPLPLLLEPTKDRAHTPAPPLASTGIKGDTKSSSRSSRRL
jgi:hypothetical protein